MPIETPTPQVPALREARLEDYEQIAQLESSVGLTPRPRDRWTDLWRANPACVRDWPIGWVLEDSAGRIVGSIGNIPAEYHLHGRRYLAATLIGWAVDPQYRAFSLMLVAHARQHPGAALQMVTTAGPMTQAVFTKLGWRRVPVGVWDQSAFWITQYSGALEAYLRKKFPSRAFASAFIAPLQAVDSLRRERVFKIDCDLEWSAGFDETFDPFWCEILARHPARFLASRTADTIRWHFHYFLERNQIWILAARRAGRLAGYAIFQRKDSPSSGIARTMLIDFQTLDPNEALPSAMLTHAFERCRGENIHVLENLGCWMQALYPLEVRTSRRRILKSWCYFYQAKDPDLGKMLADPSVWHPTLYDGDASL